MHTIAEPQGIKAGGAGQSSPQSNGFILLLRWYFLYSFHISQSKSMNYLTKFKLENSKSITQNKRAGILSTIKMGMGYIAERVITITFT